MTSKQDERLLKSDEIYKIDWHYISPSYIEDTIKLLEAQDLKSYEAGRAEAYKEIGEYISKCGRIFEGHYVSRKQVKALLQGKKPE